MYLWLEYCRPNPCHNQMLQVLVVSVGTQLHCNPLNSYKQLQNQTSFVTFHVHKFKCTQAPLSGQPDNETSKS